MSQNPEKQNVNISSNFHDELLLVERVFLRIASADSDELLAEELSKFLVPVIEKLSSPHEAVRKKIMDLLIHVNRRVKDHLSIKLPVESLVNQFKAPEANSFVTNFSMIYIKMGYPRLDLNGQIELLPLMLQCLEGKPSNHQDSFLLLMMPILGELKINQQAEKVSYIQEIKNQPILVKLLQGFIVDVLLLPYGAIPYSQQQRTPAEDAQCPPNTVPGVPAGMSIGSFKRVLGDTAIKPEDLEKLKLSLVKFLDIGVLPSSAAVIPLIVGSSDTRFSVANAAELQLRRLDGVIDWNASNNVTSLYSLFLGTITPMERTPPSKYKNPANTRIRLKLMPFLLKSREAANYTPLATKVFYECVWGQQSNARLKQLAVNFVHHVVFCAEKDKLTAVGPILFDGILKVINVESQDAKLRSLAYGALAKLSLKLPKLLISHHSQLHYIQTLMDALMHEEGDTLLAVQEALSMVAPVCKEMTPESQDQLCILLTEHIMHHNPQLRRTAVHYASSVFLLDHTPSRFILILATGDSQDDIKSEAKRKLYHSIGKNKHGSLMYSAPSFVSLLDYVVDRVNGLSKLKWTEAANNYVPFSVPVMEQIINYLEHCLEVEAQVTKRKEGQVFWSNSPAVGRVVKKIVCESSLSARKSAKDKTRGKSPFHEFIGFCELAANAWSALALESILRIVAVLPEELSSVFNSKVDWIKKFIFRGGHLGEVAAHLYGIVVGQSTSTEELEKNMKLITQIKDLRIESQEGCILAQCYSFAYFIDAQKRKGYILRTWPFFENSIHGIITQLITGNSPLQNAMITAIGQVACYTPLPLKSLQEKNKDFPYLENFINFLEKVFSNKKLHSKTGEVEIHFAVGESLSDICLGTKSSNALNPWLDEVEEDIEFTGCKRDSGENLSKKAQKTETIEKMDTDESVDDVFTSVIKEIIEMTCHSNPFVKQVSCISLLTLLKRCYQLPQLQNFLNIAQASFMNLLSDSNDFIQDAASKGLGVVYDCCSEKMQEEMVQQLVHTLMEGKRLAQTVTGDTKLFESDEIGNAPSGGGLTTYRELCSLASDLNQPDLVYKFMNLANHNAIWNSKKGAAFGFSSLTTQAESQLEPFLPQIIPKLFRYQHDPNPKIQLPMVSIWDALVKDPAKSIEKFFDAICDDLLSNMTNSAWRVRESCCYAFGDLIRRQPLSIATERVAEMWCILFRVRDDIKESVRLAADKALNTLSKCSIKACEGSSKDSEEMLRVVLSVLLSTGITSSVAEVRALSLDAVVKLCRSGGALVKPHLGTLIPAMLEALSGLESKALSYSSVRLEGDDREKLDAVRVAASKGTPMMDTINYVLQFVDNEEVLAPVITGIIAMLKQSIGLTSKTGAASVVETLVHICPEHLEKHSGKILAALVNGLTDRNAVIRKAFAHAIGSVLKTAKSSSIEKLLSKLQSWYLEKEEDYVRLSVALTLKSMHDLSADIMLNYGSEALPLAFFAMHGHKTADLDPTGAEIWSDIWSDHTPGMESGAKLYQTEIVSLCEKALESNNWVIKSQAGRALSTLVSKIGSSMEKSQVNVGVNLLLKSLYGRTWQGKENLISAVSTVAVSAKPLLLDMKCNSSESNIVDEIILVLIREAKKEKVEYKMVAISSLTKVLEAYEEDKFQEVFDICLPYLTEDPHSVQNKDTDTIERNEEKLHWDLIDELIQSLGRAWPNNKVTQEKYSEEVMTMLNSSIAKVPRVTQLSIIHAVQKFWNCHFILKDFSAVTYSVIEPVLHCTCRIFSYSLGSPNLMSHFRSELLSSVEEAKRDGQPDIQCLATSAMKLLLNS